MENIRKIFTNQEVAKILENVAAAIEILEEDRFRIAAYQRAAVSVEHCTSEVKDLWDDGKLNDIPGIGKGISSYLDELFRTGRVSHFEKLFKKIGCDVKIATDDGSAGFPGRVTELLEKSLSTMNYRLSTIYACGPKPMLKEITRISRQKRIPAQLSLESHLACGIGACLGCVVNTKDGYKRVCKEGPVFDADELLW